MKPWKFIVWLTIGFLGLFDALHGAFYGDAISILWPLSAAYFAFKYAVALGGKLR